MVKFTLRGKVYDVTREDVINAVKNIEPEPIVGRRKYVVKIGGKLYPIKQVVSLLLDLPRIAFSAGDAYRILTKLGFEIYEIKEASK